MSEYYILVEDMSGIYYGIRAVIGIYTDISVATAKMIELRQEVMAKRRNWSTFFILKFAGEIDE